MEKINNYTPGPWKINEFAEIEANNSILGKVYCGDMIPAIDEETGANAQLIALAPTLYEQHFKMLEALKRLTSNGGLLKAVYDAGETSLFFESYEKALQTIKECEL